MQDDQNQPPPIPIEYREAGADARRTIPAVLQAFLGFLTWIIAFATVVILEIKISGNVQNNSPLFWLTPVITLTAVVGLGLFARVRHRWRGFIPGLLLGLCLTCLVPVGIVYVICGPGSNRHM